MAEVPAIPDEVRSQGGVAVMKWLVEGRYVTLEDVQGLSTELGERALAAVQVEDVPTPELTPELETRLRASFDQNMAMWESLGLFTPDRETRGYARPTFEEYKAGFARHQAFTRPGRPNELNKGYDTVNFVPMDVSLVSEDSEELTMFSLLERTLREEFARAGDDKPANSLVIKTRRGQKTVLTADQVDLTEILWTWKEGYLKQQMVHRPTILAKEDHGGLSETDLLAHGTNLERKNGGFMRLDRSSLMLPQDLRRERMSAIDWKGEVGKSIPQAVQLQTAHDGIAFMIQFIQTHHFIPDVWTGDAATSQVALMPETFFPNEGSSGAVAAAGFYVSVRQFYLGRYDADSRYSDGGVRGGVRINEN